jgi:hypothetical protein
MRTCSRASPRPSHTIDETTGIRPRNSSATMRVTSARSCGCSENTSPVWPLVITATMPGCAASQEASLRKAPRRCGGRGEGQAMAGMIPP